MAAATGGLEQVAPGAQVVVRDEEWLVRSVQDTPADGLMVRVIGTSELVADQEATFFTSLDAVQPLRPEDTRLVADPTPGFRRSRLYLEALRRKTPIPAGDNRLAVGHRQLLDPLEFQREPACAALDQLRPRLLIADSVGLGKTLEVGILLSELIRRARGERILVVTPRHILEQFQHELWTRFAIPLVRLDSEGIQRVRQKIPATRNPFTYYKRAIVSIDTIKNAGRYRHHLENVGWDAVVIDECHNLINRGTLNNQLARVLAPRCEALILTSATPHNGKPESFAELVRMLDPTAIADPRSYGREEIEHLYIRRFKKDVAAEVGSQWADRCEPEPLLVEASPAENAVFDELASTWLYPVGKPPVTGAGSRLFPYTLLKAFLSSHRALAETVANRRSRVAKDLDDAEAAVREVEALDRLADVCAQIGDGEASKLAALTDTLRRIGVGPGATTRAVVFSERHATLEWLRERLPAALGLDEAAVEVLHGGQADVHQQHVVEQFALADTPVRVLLTGDIASEGVNLHRQCHQLIHFDLPWSLITIEQRNGRIDRYGQPHAPEIRALLLAPAHGRVRGDLTVLARLLEKEHHAHRTLGEAASIMGLYGEREEEDAIMRALAGRRAVDEVAPDEPADDFDLLMLIAGQGGGEQVPTRAPDRLFPHDEAFVDEALREAYEDPDRTLAIRRDPEHRLLSFVPPDDLKRRFEALPQSYLSEQRITERLRLTADRDVAEHALRRARESSDSIWPEVGFLSSQHPVVDWLVDKVLVRLGRNEAPVLLAAVDEPLVCVQGQYSNAQGQPTIVEWMAVDRLEAAPRVRPLEDVLRAAGVDHRMANPGQPRDLGALQRLVAPAAGAARRHLAAVRDERDAELRERLGRHIHRIEQWAKDAWPLADSARKRDEVERTRTHAERLAQRLATSGDPLVRIVAVLAPTP